MTEKLTPMMEQYFEIKKDYPDTLLFYRIGDFYEMFYDDAKIASRELDLILTGKSVGMPERAPMCGVPHHAVTPYIQRLVQRGYKVAIVEQTEDPKAAKGIVKRDVVRIITPGTMMDDTNNEKNSVYIASIEDCGYSYALDNTAVYGDCEFVFQATNSIMTKGVLRGGGDTKVLMLADNIFLWAASIPLGILAGFVLHMPAFWIYFCLKIDQVLKAVWCVIRLRSGKWIKKIKSTQEIEAQKA